MTQEPAFRLRYWGVRGTFSRCLPPANVTEKILVALRLVRDHDRLQASLRECSSDLLLRKWMDEHLPDHVRSTYGGNTSCVEIRTAESLFIVDAGSGLRELGSALNRQWNAPDYVGPRRGHVLITHAHLDHTVATPFNDAFYEPANDFRIWAPQSVLDSLTALLGPKSRMRSVYFPIHFDLMRGIKEMRAIEAGKEIEIEGTRIHTYELNHPGGCVAYRFERSGRRIVFASDHEHTEIPDRGLAEFARDADLLYMDAQYRQSEYEGHQPLSPEEAAHSRVGWGHSTIEAAIATALAADVRILHLGHHDPKRTDQELEELGQDARDELERQRQRANKPPGACRVQIARENLGLEL